MKPPRQIVDLEVIGYAEVLTKSLLPAIVPPVFALRSDPSVVLLPPYRINDGDLWNATSVSLSEAKSLAGAREITLNPRSIPAVVGYEMFVDQNFEVHYKPRYRVEDQLAAIFRENIDLAEKALAVGELDLAESHANVALAADDRILTPIVVKAAIRRANGNESGERLMAALVANRLSEANFRRLVDSYTRIPNFVPPVVSRSSRSMYQMAAIPTAAIPKAA